MNVCSRWPLDSSLGKAVSSPCSGREPRQRLHFGFTHGIRRYPRTSSRMRVISTNCRATRTAKAAVVSPNPAFQRRQRRPRTFAAARQQRRRQHDLQPPQQPPETHGQRQLRSQPQCPRQLYARYTQLDRRQPRTMFRFSALGSAWLGSAWRGAFLGLEILCSSGQGGERRVWSR